jgi:hypothetical protein
VTLDSARPRRCRSRSRSRCRVLRACARCCSRRRRWV